MMNTIQCAEVLVEAILSDGDWELSDLDLALEEDENHLKDCIDKRVTEKHHASELENGVV